ncbi:MAG: hypothetical protein ACYDEY_08295 [Acidimicrobiales bacterium]
MRIRTRLRYSFADSLVLVALAKHFDSLASQDLAARCKGLPGEAGAGVALSGYIGVLTGKYLAPNAEIPKGTKTIKKRPPSVETLGDEETDTHIQVLVALGRSGHQSIERRIRTCHAEPESGSFGKEKGHSCNRKEAHSAR